MSAPASTATATGTTSPVVPATATPTGNAPTGVTAGGPNAGYASASLYVGDLSPDVTEALLFEIFNAVGPVASVRVCRDAATRRSLGYAYVNFHRVDDAERALDTMNFKPIRNRACRIMWSHRDPSLRKSGLGNVFVNHLAKSIDNKQLYDTFSVFGNILSCKVATNQKRESLGYGFVHYESDEAAAQAISRVDGKVIAGEKVSVSHFKSKKDRGGNDKVKFTNVFVKNLPADITKEAVDALFAKHGTITSSVVNADKENKRTSAFVNFETAEQAAAAVDALNNHEIDGKKLFVSRAQKREEREKELRDKFEAIRAEKQKKYAGVNLYVKNLADDMDDKKLNEEFSKYGTITNAAIMIDPVTKKSRGFGFVCYSTPEEATKAVTELNGRMIDGKPLYVALAQRKDARRAQLEAQYAARAKLNNGPMGAAGMNGYVAQLHNNPAAMMYAQQQAMRNGQQYQGQMGANGYQGIRGQNPNMMGPVPNQWNMRQQPVNYQLMPQSQRMQQMGPRGQQQQRLPNQQQRGAQPNTRINPMMNANGKAPLGQQNMASNIRYSEQVRNRNQAPLQQQQQQDQTQQQQPTMPAPNEPLTIKALAAAPEEMRKQMIGERLFPLIKMQEPTLAGKITGMLLEMDNGELIHLLESQQALHEKIAEALSVLQAHPQEQQQEQQEA